MIRARVITFLLVFFFLVTLAPRAIPQGDSPWLHDPWKYHQEIPLPFDTSLPGAKYQPIDLVISFEHPCWAIDELNESLRVVMQDGDSMVELESQIYDLNHTDTNHIGSCNLVFLIPQQATGKEHYDVYYSDEETPSPQYPDHLTIEEAYYYFAPIPGFPFESTYYKITQDGNIIYGIASSGQFLGTSTAQQITLLQNNVTTVTSPQDSLAIASFDYFYYYGTNTGDFASTIQKLISKEILIQGNLLVSCGIVSETTREDFRTTATYKYYYCPDPGSRRVYAHVKHEALKATQVVNVPPNSQSAGNFLSFEVLQVKSPSIPELNFGQLYPMLDVYAHNDRILSYPQDMNPEYTPGGITVIKTDDGVTLGKKSWACYDMGITGMAHSIILGSTHVLVSGTDEHDGAQVKAYEAAGPGLLGLRSTGESFAFSRNAYQNGTNDFSVPADLIIEFDADFFSTFHGGYPAVDNESTLFQAAIKTRPHPGGVAGETQHHQTFSLKTFVHLAPSVPLGTVLSILTGRNFSYITAELYRENDLTTKGIVGRASLTAIPTFGNATLLKKIKIALRFLDLRNLTLFKKIQFDNLQPGTYLIKIFREHPRIGSSPKYIGYKIVTLEDNMTTHIFCHQEGHISLSVTDQYGTPVTDIQASLLMDNITVADATTTSNAATIISVPGSFHNTYRLMLLYKGFQLYNQPVSVPARTALFPRKISVEVPLYDLTLYLADLWGIPPTEVLTPVLTSPEMKQPVLLSATPVSAGRYHFDHLYPGTYLLQVTYNSVVLQENITIPMPAGNNLTLILPTRFHVTITTYDTRGTPLSIKTMMLERDGKTVALNGSGDGRFFTLVPPGVYTATVFHDDVMIGKRKLTVIGDRTFDFVTQEEPLFPVLIIVIVTAVGVIASLLILRKHDVVMVMKILAMVLAVISLVIPWWTIQGSSNETAVTTQTHLYLLPASLISSTTTPTVIAGERASASAPALFTTFIMMLTGAILASMLCITLGMMFQRGRRKKLTTTFNGIGVALLIVTVCAFFVVMSMITKVGVGGVFGQSIINVNIPGESMQEPVFCQWGLDNGFYLACLAFILLLISIIVSWKKQRNRA